MASNRAGVRIDGDANGATRAGKRAKAAVEEVGKAGKKAGDDIAKGMASASKAEKEFESQVQRSIQRLREKEQRAKASAEAERRLGINQGPNNGAQPASAPPRPLLRGRPRAAGGAGGGGGAGVRGIFEGLSRGGGAIGGLAGQGAAALGAASGPLMALGGAALGVTVALTSLASASERAAKAAGEQARAAIQRREAVRQGREQLGNTAVDAAAQGGARLRDVVGRGTSLRDIGATQSRTGSDVGNATELAALTKGLAPELRRTVERAFTDAQRLGGSGLEAARFASETAREFGGFGSMTRQDLARMGLEGGAGSTRSSADIGRGLRNPDAIRLSLFDRYGNREGGAKFRTLLDRQALGAADEATGRAASRAADPVNANLEDIRKAQLQQVEILQAQADASNQVVELLGDIKMALIGGEGSYGRRAAEARALIQ